MDKLLRDTMQCINEIMREAVVIDVEFKHCTTHLELADAFQEINDQFHHSYPLPVRPRPSPEHTPLPPRTRGPVEMPMLADGDRHNHTRGPHCYKCRSPNHLVSVCPKSCKNRRCTFCGDGEHRVSRCPTKCASRVVDDEVVLEAPLAFVQATETEEMSLLDRISLLERTEWTPEVCIRCRKQNPRHTELECPVYERCDRCGGSGPYGYKRCHTCYPIPNEDEVSLVDYDNADYDLYWADDQERVLDKVVATLCLKGGLCHDSAHIFHFLLLLFITCTITVGHMTDVPSFCT
jgi:hypothetical protein